MVQVQTNKVFKELEQSDKRIRVFQGGTRSGKTRNIVIWWIIKLMNEENKVLTVARESMVSLKNTVFRDFMEVLWQMGIYNAADMNKGDMIYKIGSNIIEFRNLDDDQKVRGAKRNYLYINEANEVSHPIFKQLLFRTEELVVLDYNPSDEYHWIYDSVLTRDDCDFFKSTYLDNPFLPEEQIKEIERLKDIDPNYWRVYGLGERGMSEATIYKNWELTNMPEPEGEVFYGLDFGFNDPNALLKVVICDGFIWVKELLYQNQLTTPQLIEEIKKHDIKQTDKIFGDNSRPETIEEIYSARFNIHPCVKGPGSIKSGIDWIKRQKILITKDSLNLIKEIRSYKWKVDKNEKVLDDPVDYNNHLLDALRYAFSDKVASKKPDDFSVLEFSF
jgi:phage terminase large subunit